jgi:hypothetical protein
VRWLAHIGTDLPVAFARNTGDGIVAVIPACLSADQAERLMECAATPIPILDLSPRAAGIAAAPGAQQPPSAIPHAPALQVEQQTQMDRIPLNDLVMELTVDGVVFRSASDAAICHRVSWAESGLASGNARSARLLILMAEMLKESEDRARADRCSETPLAERLRESRHSLTTRSLAYADLGQGATKASELDKAKDRVAHRIDFHPAASGRSMHGCTPGFDVVPTGKRRRLDVIYRCCKAMAYSLL